MIKLSALPKLKKQKKEIAENLRIIGLDDYAISIENCFETVYRVKGECGE